MQRAEPAIWKCVEPVVAGLGYELVGIEYKYGSGTNVLRVYIDSANGVTLDDCAEVSTQLSAALDVEDPIPVAYCLEVSSPGLDRPLFKEADFRRFAGKRARIRMKVAQHGRRNYRGKLIGVQGTDVVVEVDGVRHELSLQDIAEARLVPAD